MNRYVSYILLAVSVIIAACGAQPTTPQIAATTIVATAYPAPTATPTQAQSVIVSTPKAQIEDGGIDQTDVPTTVAWLHQQYGRFFSATIVRQVLGDEPSITLQIKGDQYLIKEDLYVNNPEYDVLWPVGPGSIDVIKPGTGLVIITKNLSHRPYACFIYGAQVPQVTASVDDPSIFEGKYVSGNTLDACFDTIMVLDDGRGVFINYGIVSDQKEGTVKGTFEGWAHWEFNSIRLTDAPRDPAKDSLAIMYAEEIRALPFDRFGKPVSDYPTVGPIESCLELRNNWSHLTELSPVTVEWVCGGRLNFEERYAVTSWGEGYYGEAGRWIVGTARIPIADPIILTHGATRQVDFRTFVEVADTGVCKDIEGATEVWVNQISTGNINGMTYCVRSDEYLFILPLSAVNFENGAYFIPEDALAFRFVQQP